MIKGRILIILGDKRDRESLGKLLLNEVEEVVMLPDPGRIYELLERNETDIILLGTDFNAGVRGGNEGLYWLSEITRVDNTISVIMVAESGEVERAAGAVGEGAVDYLRKPWDPTKIIASINTAWKLRMRGLEASRLKRDNILLKEEINRGGERIITGASPTMINVMNIVRKVAATEANILITGENGTGKELVAREIHRLSKRSSELLVTVDMGSITETLFESELFGHARGAFTDAREERTGKFETAHRGTLFLDEIGNLSLRAQAKLLSVLQNRHIVRVGSNKRIPIDIRLICATNSDLPRMFSEGSFREDLYYRINTIMIEVPPLRDRVDDIPILANYFLRINGERYGKDNLKINAAALGKLANHEWPGNIRELQHTIEKAVILADSDILTPSDFSFSAKNESQVQGEMTLAEMERRMIIDYIKKYSNNLSVVAVKLGISRQTLYNKMSRYGI